jgi:hypothetical protein
MSSKVEDVLKSKRGKEDEPRKVGIYPAKQLIAIRS